MSDITLTLIRHRGAVMPLGRNAAIKLLLDKSKPKKVLDTNRLANAARNLWERTLHYKQLSYNTLLQQVPDFVSMTSCT